MRGAVELCKSLGFDGVDINMGCPDKSIEKSGCGADCIRHPERSIAVYKAACEGGLPISVKTRIGYNKQEIDTWLRTILEQKPVTLTVHLRTRKEMSFVPAHWELMPQIVALRNEVSPSTILIGNGDVLSKADGLHKIHASGCDGVMVGRGIFGNPWFFAEDQRERSTQEKLDACIEHTQLFEKLLGDIKSFAIMKKHFKAYINGFDGARELRTKLMEEAKLRHRCGTHYKVFSWLIFFSSSSFV